MIKELILYNWKSFAEATLFIDPLTIVIGTNASGKSNVLDAFLLLQKLSFGKQITAAIVGDNESPSGIRGGLEWVVRKPERETAIEILIESDLEENVDYRYEIRLGLVNGNRIELLSETLTKEKKQKRGNNKYSKKLFYTNSDGYENKPSINTYFSTGTQGYGKKIEFSKSFSILSQAESLNLKKDVSEACNLVLNHLRSIFILDVIPSHMRKYSSLSEKLLPDASNISGVLAALPDEKRYIVENTITQYLRELPERDITKVYSEKVGKFETDAMLYCEEQWKSDKSFTVDLRGMSDGTLRFLGILVALLTIESKSLLIIEEIDNGLHPSRAKLLVEMLQKIGLHRNIDVICTTHNPAMLDALGNRLIPFISLAYRDSENGCSNIKPIDDFDQLAKLMSYGTLGRLATNGEFEKLVNQ